MPFLDGCVFGARGFFPCVFVTHGVGADRCNIYVNVCACLGTRARVCPGSTLYACGASPLTHTAGGTDTPPESETEPTAHRTRAGRWTMDDLWTTHTWGTTRARAARAAFEKFCSILFMPRFTRRQRALFLTPFTHKRPFRSRCTNTLHNL